MQYILKRRFVMKKWTFICLIGSLFLLTTSMSYAADSKEFKFGEILAITGSGSWYGMTMERGTNIAIDEINKDGGSGGYTFIWCGGGS
jgi:hypothetical protein